MAEIILRLILIIFATHRVTQFLTMDYGPFFIWQRWRNFTDKKRADQQDKNNHYGLWTTIDEVFRCPFCMGIYVSFVFVYSFMDFDNLSLFVLYWFAVAGAQSYLQGQEKPR